MNEEQAKQNYLRKIFGGALEPQSESDLDEFASTREGQEFMQSSDELRRLLREVAVVRPKRVDSQAMIRRFEDAVRENARQAQARLRWALAGTVILWALFATAVFLQCGWSELTGLALLGAAAMGSVGLVMYVHNRRMLDEEHLYDLLRTSRQRAQTAASRIATALIVTATVALVGYTCWRFTGPRGLVTYVALFALLVWFGRYQRRKLRERDQEVWDWWEGNSADSTGEASPLE